MNSELYELLSSEFLPFEGIFSGKFSGHVKREAENVSKETVELPITF